MRGLPRQAQIGYRTYRIRPLDPVSAEDCQGRTQRPLGLIQLDRRLPDQELAGALVHELVHDILDVHGLIEGPQQDEHLVGHLANGLCQAFADNPRLWLWIFQRLVRRH